MEDKRGRFGVNVSVDVSAEERLRLVFDDVAALDETGARWRKTCFFTFIDVDKQAALKYQFDRDACAAIGGAVLARLLALYSLGEEVEIEED
jgi:hypothetical protein